MGNWNTPLRILVEKNEVLLFSICICIVFFSTNSTKAQKKTERPNIVFIIADDVSPKDIGAYGNSNVQTPNIDQIAKEGIRFTNVYLTTSSCSPSRTSIISGRYPHNTGSPELHMPLPPEVPIFPELLQEAGYYTAQAGKWHMGYSARRGFDLIHDGRKENGDGGEEMWVPTLKNRPKDKPFFMWFASYDGHRPWGPNKFSGSNDPATIVPPPYLVDGNRTRVDLAKYYDEVTRLDHHIGKVEQELAQQGVLENTIIIIMADNGRPFPRSKGRLYDSGIRTPFIVKWGKINRNGVASHSLISAVDLAPTVLTLAGADIPLSFQGKSFEKILENPSFEFREYVFAEHNWHDYEAAERMVRTKNFLYIKNLRPSLSNPGAADVVKGSSFQELITVRDKGNITVAQANVFITPRPSEELFNTTKDPMQLLNVVSMPRYKSVLNKLRNKLKQWRAETFDTVDVEGLTQDWFDRETGEVLYDPETGVSLFKLRRRGDIPGDRRAIKTTEDGLF